MDFQAYKVQMLQVLQPDDMPRRLNCVIEMLECIDSDVDILQAFFLQHSNFWFAKKGQMTQYDNIGIRKPTSCGVNSPIYPKI